MKLIPDNIAWHTDVGRFRKNNEDCCAFQISPDGATGLLIVADGMGGAACGEVASQMAVDVLLQTFKDHGFDDARTTLETALHTAHRRIQQAAANDDSKAGMGTTVVATVLRANRVVVGHVGDSRALQLRGDNARRLTRDHLFAIDALGVDENKAKHHSKGNVLSQAIGTDQEILPTLNTYDLEPGDSIVLCTDGVSEHVSEPIMHAALTSQSLPDAAAALVRRALRNGSKDNCTVVVATIPYDAR